MQLSIILLAYNVDNYITQSIESILKLDVNYQLIIVIGLSNDNTDNIVHNFEKKCKNIIVIHQDGQGISNAKNCGLKYATGDFVVFFDGDDYIISDKLNNILNNIIYKKNFDIAISDYNFFYDGNNVLFCSNQLKNISKVNNNRKKMDFFLKKKKAFWNTWRYIYKRDFLLENKLFFTEGIYAEDLEHTTRVFVKAKKILFLKDSYYCYRLDRQGSLMNSISECKLADTINVIEKSINYIYDEKYIYKKKIYKQYIKEFILNIELISNFNNDEIKDIVNFVRTKIYLLKKEKCIFSMFFYINIYIFGLNNIINALSIMRKIKRKIKKFRNGLFKKILQIQKFVN